MQTEDGEVTKIDNQWSAELPTGAPQVNRHKISSMFHIQTLAKRSQTDELNAKSDPKLRKWPTKGRSGTGRLIK